MAIDAAGSRHVIHVVATRNFAGVERYVTYVAPLLRDAGWRVTVVGGNPTSMRAVLDPAGTTWVEYRGLLALTRWLARHARRAHIVHVHMSAAELAAAGALPLSRARLVATRHFAAPRGSSWPARLALRIARSRIDGEISPSEYVARAIETPSVVIPHGVPDRPAGLHDQRVVLVAHRLEAEKRTDVALRAFAASELASHGWIMHVLGEGAQRPFLERLSADLGVAASVQFFGRVADVDRRLGEAALFLATAPAEPFGLSVVEAMASGCAVVAASGGAHRETLPDGYGGLFAPGDVAACAAALGRLAFDPGARSRLGVELRARQQLLFTPAVHVRKLLAVYDDVLATRSSSSE